MQDTMRDIILDAYKKADSNNNLLGILAICMLAKLERAYIARPNKPALKENVIMNAIKTNMLAGEEVTKTQSISIKEQIDQPPTNLLIEGEVGENNTNTIRDIATAITRMYEVAQIYMEEISREYKLEKHIRLDASLETRIVDSYLGSIKTWWKHSGTKTSNLKNSIINTMIIAAEYTYEVEKAIKQEKYYCDSIWAYQYTKLNHYPAKTHKEISNDIKIGNYIRGLVNIQNEITRFNIRTGFKKYAQ